MRFTVILAPILCLLAIVAAHPILRVRSYQLMPGIPYDFPLEVTWDYTDARQNGPKLNKAQEKAKKKLLGTIANGAMYDPSLRHLKPDPVASITLSYDATSQDWSAPNVTYQFSDGNGKNVTVKHTSFPSFYHVLTLFGVPL